MAEVLIRTPEGTVGVPARWVAFVARVLGAPDGFLTVLDEQADCYVQACNEDGTLLLEYRDGSPSRHYQVRGVELDDVAEALAQWVAGKRGFIARHDWTRLTLWDEPHATPS